MLASAAELGISRDHAGVLELDAAAQARRSDAGLAPDFIIEIDNKSLTHRPDLWGHYGMAREVAAITGLPLIDPVKPGLLPSGDSPVKVRDRRLRSLPPLQRAGLRKRHGRAFAALAAGAARTSWASIPSTTSSMCQNLIMAELPQPTHAYDADKLNWRYDFRPLGATMAKVAGAEWRNLHADTRGSGDRRWGGSHWLGRRDRRCGQRHIQHDHAHRIRSRKLSSVQLALDIGAA